MPRSPKPSDSARESEYRRTNVLLEAIRKEVRLIAENHLSLRADIQRVKSSTMLLDVLHSEFSTFKGALLEIAGDVKILKGDVAELKTDVKDIKDRFTLVEAK